MLFRAFIILGPRILLILSYSCVNIQCYLGKNLPHQFIVTWRVYSRNRTLTQLFKIIHSLSRFSGCLRVVKSSHTHTHQASTSGLSLQQDPHGQMTHVRSILCSCTVYSVFSKHRVSFPLSSSMPLFSIPSTQKLNTHQQASLSSSRLSFRHSSD